MQQQYHCHMALYWTNGIVSRHTNHRNLEDLRPPAVGMNEFEESMNGKDYE